VGEEVSAVRSALPTNPECTVGSIGLCTVGCTRPPAMASRSSLLPLLLLCTAAAASCSTPSRNAELDALMELKAALDPSRRATATPEAEGTTSRG